MQPQRRLATPALAEETTTIMSQTHHLGCYDAPLLIFGGPYGNRHALEALLSTAETLDIPPSHMLCTGDLAAYAADTRLRRAG